LFAESLQDESWKIVGMVGVFSASSDRYRSIGSRETGIKKELGLGV
jgi:hypothetical protein